MHDVPGARGDVLRTSLGAAAQLSLTPQINKTLFAEAGARHPGLRAVVADSPPMECGAKMPQILFTDGHGYAFKVGCCVSLAML